MIFDYNILNNITKNKPSGFKKFIIQKSIKTNGGNIYLSDENVRFVTEKYKNKTNFYFKIKLFFRHITKNLILFTKFHTIFTNYFKAQKRYNICKKCEAFNSKNKKCKICGCYMNIKVRLIYAECPLNKWD